MPTRETNADSTGREAVGIRLFAAPGELNSRLAEDTVRRLLDERHADPGDLEVIDALSDPSVATTVGVTVLPTLVVGTPAGPCLIPGSLKDDTAVADALAGGRSPAPATDAGLLLDTLLRGEIDAVLGDDGPLLMRPLAEEGSLRESRRRLETLARATFEGVAITEQGRYLDVNPQMAEMFGYQPDEIAGMEVATLIAPEDRERVMAMVMRGVEGFVEFRARRKDGSTFSAESQSRILVHEDRQIRVSAIRDVTARKTAERERERLLFQMRGIIASMNEGLVIADASGHVLEMNPAALALHGFSSAEQVRRHVADFADTFELFDLEGEPLPVDRWPLARVLNGETFSEVRRPRPSQGQRRGVVRPLRRHRRARPGRQPRPGDRHPARRHPSHPDRGGPPPCPRRAGADGGGADGGPGQAQPHPADDHRLQRGHREGGNRAGAPGGGVPHRGGHRRLPHGVGGDGGARRGAHGAPGRLRRLRRRLPVSDPDLLGRRGGRARPHRHSHPHRQEHGRR